MKCIAVVCTYNGEKFLGEQLESIICQSRKIDKLYLGDDRSTDGTIRIAEKYMSESGIPYDIVVNEVNLGVTRNFEETCIRALSNADDDDIIFFSDQDDVWEKDKTEKILSAFVSSGKELVFTNAVVEYGTDKADLFDRIGFNKRYFDKDQLNTFIRGYFVTGATMACRAGFLRKHIPFCNTWLHDQWLSFCAALTDGMCMVDEKLIHYRQHGNNVVGVQKTDDIPFQEKIVYRDNSKKLKEYESALECYGRGNIAEDKMLQIEQAMQFLHKQDEIWKAPHIKRVFMILKNIRLYRRFALRPVKHMIRDILVKNKK